MGEGCATLAHARWHAEESGISIVAIRLTTERESTGGSNPLPALHCLAATCKPISFGVCNLLHVCARRYGSRTSPIGVVHVCDL